MWGDGANHLTATFKVEESRITNVTSGFPAQTDKGHSTGVDAT